MSTETVLIEWIFRIGMKLYGSRMINGGIMPCRLICGLIFTLVWVKCSAQIHNDKDAGSLPFPLSCEADTIEGEFLFESDDRLWASVDYILRSPFFLKKQGVTLESSDYENAVYYFPYSGLYLDGACADVYSAYHCGRNFKDSISTRVKEVKLVTSFLDTVETLQYIRPVRWVMATYGEKVRDSIYDIGIVYKVFRIKAVVYDMGKCRVTYPNYEDYSKASAGIYPDRVGLVRYYYISHLLELVPVKPEGANE